MPVERALTAYQKERLNCAQSVLRAFQSHRNIPEDDIAEAKFHGGGRAEGGLCGALYAALKLVPEPEARQRVRDAFVAVAGADTCREIKRTARTPCVECVRIAARLLVDHGVAPPAGANNPKDV
jgi:hypothetical protein